MLKKIFAVALLAGFLGGAGISLVQEVTTTPLILKAEEFENTASLSGAFTPVAYQLVHGTEKHGDGAENEWAPQDGLERFAYTALANIFFGVGFALLLVAAFLIHGEDMNGRRGVVWGFAGFAVFTMAPSLGLPPELPGSGSMG